jgi:NAD-dependent SIR2 family protein deacetylase
VVNARIRIYSEERRAKVIAYTIRHQRVRKARGPAKYQNCIDCGEVAEHWSRIHDKDGEDPNDYEPRCRPCHRKYDNYIF